MSRVSPRDDPLVDALLSAGIPDQSRLLVAVSGGPDSVALLAALRRVTSSGEGNWTLRVGHVNHGLRGGEADDDEAFVRALGGQWGLTVDVRRVDTRGFAASHKLSIEAAARELRYRALQEMLTLWSGDFILTGHTQDDQAETLLLHLLRGSGIAGLGGIRAWRGNLVRPFLAVPKETIIRSLQQHRLGYRLDTSNVDVRHARNRVRRDVIPVLELLQPKVGETLGRTAALLAIDSDFVMTEAARTAALSVLHGGSDWVRVSTSSLLSLHPALRSHVLRVLLEEVAGHPVDISEIHCRQISQALEHRQEGIIGSLPRGVTMEIAAGSIVFRRTQVEGLHLAFDLPLSIPGTLHTSDWELQATVNTVSDRERLRRQVVVCGPWHALCDAERLGPNLRVRSRRPGDRIIPLGMTGSRKLQDVFVDAHVPRDARDAIPLVANQKHIVWIPGIMLDTRAALGDTTEHVAHLVYRRISQ